MGTSCYGVGCVAGSPFVGLCVLSIWMIAVIIILVYSYKQVKNYEKKSEAKHESR